MKTLLQTLVGTWIICGTNFPMWLNGNKTQPTFNYSLVSRKDGTAILLDEVKYLKNGKPKTITGYDYPDETDSMAFVWRGKGLTSLLRSRWRVALLDPQAQWAVITFSKTLFTPAGVDIISRRPLPAATLQHIRQLMSQDPTLQPHLATLTLLNP